MVVKKSSKNKTTVKPTSEQYFSRGKTSKNNSSGCECSGAIYFLGFVGGLVYYISASAGFWSGVLGVLKAMVWPAMLVLKLLAL